MIFRDVEYYSRTIAEYSSRRSSIVQFSIPSQSADSTLLLPNAVFA